MYYSYNPYQQPLPFSPGLPVQVRDAALKIADEMPKSEVNKEFYLQNMETEVTHSNR